MDKYQSDKGLPTTADDPNRMVWHSLNCGFWTDEWDTLGSTSKGFGGIPICPTCGYPGMMTTAKDWNKGTELYDAAKPGYKEFIDQTKGVCFGRGGFQKELEKRGFQKSVVVVNQKVGYAPVPVLVAEAIALQYKKSQVIILAWDAKHKLLHTTTYGVEAFDKESAAAAGEIASKALGSDLSKKKVFEDFHQDYDPALFKEAIEILRTLSRRQGIVAPFNITVEKFLKRCGHSVRSDGS